MTEQTVCADVEVTVTVDPSAWLAKWANSNDEWIRLLIAEVIASGRPVGRSTINKAYRPFRQEKEFDGRTLSAVENLSTGACRDENAPPLSDVHGVNALVSGEIIVPHDGLTLVDGENGTGRTHYSHIFKTLVVDEIHRQATLCLTADTSINFDNKIVMSIAIRLSAEKYMVDQFGNLTVTDGIEANQSATLLKSFRNSAHATDKTVRILEAVMLMTPENLHVNSFMYEPILDMSDAHLRQLYRDIKALGAGTQEVVT